MVSDIRHRSCLAWFVPRDVARWRGSVVHYSVKCLRSTQIGQPKPTPRQRSGSPSSTYRREGAGDGFCSAARPSPSASAVPADYVVQAGDTLQSIARKLYGSSDLWRGLLQPQRIVK
jgi:hypothetical protein